MAPTVTTTWTICPAVPAGDMAVHFVSKVHVTFGDAIVPNFTVVFPAVLLNPVPVITTGVPPAAGPVAGRILLTDTKAAAVYL